MFWGNARKLLDDKIMGILYQNIVSAISGQSAYNNVSKDNNESNENKNNEKGNVQTETAKK